jgi:hypothetical protein
LPSAPLDGVEYIVEIAPEERLPAVNHFVVSTLQSVSL